MDYLMVATEVAELKKVKLNLQIKELKQRVRVFFNQWSYCCELYQMFGGSD